MNENELDSRSATARFFIYVVAIAGVFLSVVLIFGALFGKKEPTSTMTAASSQMPTLAEYSPTPLLPATTDPTDRIESAWVYENQHDPMTGKSTKLASVFSTNTLSLGFPYQGLQRAELTIRNSPRYGLDVYLQIEKGQFLAGVSGVRVLARFDDNAPEKFWAYGPEDYGTTTLFIQNEAKFISRLRKAKTLNLSTPIYQEGEPVMTFRVEGLKW